jgi:ABC-type amino acid transport substrate-binding protein
VWEISVALRNTLAKSELIGENIRASHIPIPGAKAKEFHAMVTKAPTGGEKLLKIINDGIVASKADKTYTKIMNKYGI